jgi:transposase
MAGKFEGLTDKQWEKLEPFFPKIEQKRGCAHKHAPWRNLLNTILWVLITGARWCDVPRRENFASKSTSHRWLGKWQENGTLQRAWEIIDLLHNPKTPRNMSKFARRQSILKSLIF